VLDYRSGLEDWQHAGFPVEKKGEPPAEPKPAEGRHEIDPAKSSLRWTGRNINGSHTGTISLKSGWIEVKNGQAAGGEFTLDMESITNTDLADGALNRLLVAHLKSDDLFDTARHPTATFALRHITLNPRSHPGSVNADVVGSLTMKGITHELAFPAVVEALTGGALGAEAHFDIDRTRWNVLYGSGKFYERLGMHLVHDAISISLRIVTR
jgi:polyisoprenoid-binding protein YceI